MGIKNKYEMLNLTEDSGKPLIFLLLRDLY